LVCRICGLGRESRREEVASRGIEGVEEELELTTGRGGWGGSGDSLHLQHGNEGGCHLLSSCSLQIPGRLPLVQVSDVPFLPLTLLHTPSSLPLPPLALLTVRWMWMERRHGKGEYGRSACSKHLCYCPVVKLVRQLSQIHSLPPLSPPPPWDERVRLSQKSPCSPWLRRTL